MFEAIAEKFRDELILVARIFLTLLFIIFGWKKLFDFEGTIGYMAATHAPFPPIAAGIAVFVELIVATAILLGTWTRPLVLLLMIYTLGTSIMGHHYWNMSGAEQYGNMINFYKNLSIIGGLLLLFVTGAGRYSVSAKLGLK